MSAEVVAEDLDGMLREGRHFSKLASDVVVKVPMSEIGLEAITRLAAEGIKTNCTLIFSSNQGLLAAKAGASLLSPFVGRLDDINQDGMPSTVPDSLSRYEAACPVGVVSYTRRVPKLWDETIEAHRAAVRDATLNTAATLVAKHGLRSVTMSEIAEQTGIGRATLYKYFPDVEAILFAWHEREIIGHLGQLADARDQAGDAGERLEAVLEAYALISDESHGHHDAELAAAMHRDEHVARAEQQLRNMVRDLLTEAVATGDVRDDVAPDELASFCLHALTAASSVPSNAAVRRLIMVTLAGIRPRA